MNGYSVKLHLIALHKYLEHKGYILLDALCARSYDYVAVDANGKLNFIYADIDGYIPPPAQLEKEVSDWFSENPSYKMPYQYEVYIVTLTGNEKAKIKLVKYYQTNPIFL